MRPTASDRLVLIVAALVLIGSTVLAGFGVVGGSDAVTVYTLIAGYAFGKVQPRPQPDIVARPRKDGQ